MRQTLIWIPICFIVSLVITSIMINSGDSMGAIVLVNIIVGGVLGFAAAKAEL